MISFGAKRRPILIAEIGGNHEGDFDAALRLTDLAIAGGADAVKFQIYYGDTLVSEVESPQRNAHFRRFELSPAEHLALADRVTRAGRAYMASVWDLDAFEWVDPAVAAYKIGSGDLTALPFLRAAAETGKPLLLSTGLSDLVEVEAAVQYIRACHPVYRDPAMLAVLQCTSMYPTEPGDVNLSVMRQFSTLAVSVGYSDHTIGCRALEVAAAMGADVLEFHFTDRKQGRPFRDHQLSLDLGDLVSLVRALDEQVILKGGPEKRPLPSEIDAGHVQSFRRGVYPTRDIDCGEVLGEHNLCVLRPNKGIDARQFYQLTGRRAARRLVRHESLDWRDIE